MYPEYQHIPALKLHAWAVMYPGNYITWTAAWVEDKNTSVRQSRRYEASMDSRPGSYFGRRVPPAKHPQHSERSLIVSVSCKAEMRTGELDSKDKFHVYLG